MNWIISKHFNLLNLSSCWLYYTLNIVGLLLFLASFIMIQGIYNLQGISKPNLKTIWFFLIFRCYDLLIRSHPEKLIQGLLLRLNSVDENIRVSTLIVFRHLMNSSLEVLQTRMSDIFNALHSKLNETSNRVRKMLAQLTGN